MKRTPPKAIKLSPEQIADIERAVFSAVESQLPSQFYLLAVDFEKEAGYWYLRIYLEGRGFTVSLSDCADVSQLLDPVLENLDELRDLSYSLEISSPGLFRPLKTAREFEFYAGRPVLIEKQPPVPAKKHASKPPVVLHEGILQGFNAAEQAVTLAQDGNQVTVALEADMVVRLNPMVRFPEEESE